MAAITGSSSLEPVFLQVGVGDAVLVEPHEGGWWVGQVIHCEGGARNYWCIDGISEVMQVGP